VTSRWEGVVDYCDRLGSFQPIPPGAINWMTSGRSIGHSELSLGDQLLTGPRLLVFHERAVRLRSDARRLLFGGNSLKSPRHIWWNVVSSSPDRIEPDKQDWREGRFPLVAGDEQERVPLPEGP
jgi:redox-sensitive bicupin YhaK (pirin superfamily)